jgi:hypothetical protein
MKMRDAAEITMGIMGLIRIVYAVCDAPRLIFAAFTYFARTATAATPSASADLEMMTFQVRITLQRSLADFLANLVCGIILVLLARRIAGWLTRTSAQLAAADVELRIVSPEGFRFCLKLVGILSLATVLPFLVQWPIPGPGMPGIAITIIGGAVALALPIYLVFGGKWLARIAWGKPG